MATVNSKRLEYGHRMSCDGAASFSGFWGWRMVISQLSGSTVLDLIGSFKIGIK